MIRVRWAVIGGCIAFAVAATGAFATHFTSGDRLQACAMSTEGQLRLVTDAAECRPSEEAVSWPASVPAGGATTFETVTVTVPTGPSGIASATATCPSGGRVVGGGGHATPVTGGNIIATSPAGDDAWTATAVTNPSAQSFSVYAICAMG